MLALPNLFLRYCGLAVHIVPEMIRQVACIPALCYLDLLLSFYPVGSTSGTQGDNSERLRRMKTCMYSKYCSSSLCILYIYVANSYHDLIWGFSRRIVQLF